jgi:hypothetical protein
VRAVGLSGNSPWSNRRSVIVPAILYLPLLARNYDAQASTGKIENGDFEEGPLAWIESSSSSFDLIIDWGFPSGVAPHGGNWAAWLGGGYNEISSLEQLIEVPVSKPYVHYWYWVSSVTEPCEEDYAQVLADDVTVELVYLCLAENTGGWREHSVDLGPYAGQSINLRIYVRTWPDTFSSLFVDDLSFRTTAATEEPSTQGLAAPATLEPREPGEPSGIER